MPSSTSAAVVAADCGGSVTQASTLLNDDIHTVIVVHREMIAYRKSDTI